MDFFYMDTSRKDGFRCYCKKCDKLYAETHKEKIKTRRKKYYKSLQGRIEDEIPYPEEKKCSKCKKTKPSAEFYKSKKVKCGLYCHCIECCKRNARGKAYKQICQNYLDKLKNRKEEDIIIPKRKYCPKCEKKLSYKKFTKTKYSKDGLASYCKKCKNQYYNEDHERRNAQREKRKQWERNNRERRNKYLRDKTASNIKYRILKSLRVRLREGLKSQNVKKTSKTMELIGCSIEKLRKHIGSQFVNGMTWENYGVKGWHIDHIKPCKAFDLTKTEEQKKCFNYTNLQPLWWYDNISKATYYNGMLL